MCLVLRTRFTRKCWRTAFTGLQSRLRRGWEASQWRHYAHTLAVKQRPALGYCVFLSADTQDGLIHTSYLKSHMQAELPRRLCHSLVTPGDSLKI